MCALHYYLYVHSCRDDVESYMLHGETLDFHLVHLIECDMTRTHSRTHILNVVWFHINHKGFGLPCKASLFFYLTTSSPTNLYHQLFLPYCEPRTQKQEIVQRGGWRTKVDVSTFFFCRFFEDFREEDLWRIFQWWGKVWEIYVAKRRNRSGHRYDYVIFKGVQNERIMEQ